MSVFQKRLAALTPAILRDLRRGVEKESLRVRADGSLADTPHPPALGSPLTHPNITTDFSEAQLELITGVHTDAEACAAELTEIHQFVYRNISEEMLWCSSMPCKLPADDAIPIGRYGRSNIGTAPGLDIYSRDPVLDQRVLDQILARIGDHPFLSQPDRPGGLRRCTGLFATTQDWIPAQAYRLHL